MRNFSTKSYPKDCDTRFWLTPFHSWSGLATFPLICRGRLLTNELYFEKKRDLYAAMTYIQMCIEVLRNFLTHNGEIRARFTGKKDIQMQLIRHQAKKFNVSSSFGEILQKNWRKNKKKVESQKTINTLENVQKCGDFNARPLECTLLRKQINASNSFE